MIRRKDIYNENSSLVGTHKIRIRFNECDPLGIVWHGNYIKYFEDGRETFGEQHGISYLDVQRNGFATPIVKTTSEHKLTLKYGDVVVIKTKFVNTAAAKIIFRYEIYNPEGKLACTGETVQVFIDSAGNLQLNNPLFYQQWKQKMNLL